MIDLVIGIGNDFRGDDKIGLDLVRGLPDERAQKKILSDGNVTDLLSLISPDKEIVLVDCVVSGNPPGKVVMHDLNKNQFVVGSKSSTTHGFGLAEFISLVKLMNLRPKKFILIGIEGINFKIGSGYSFDPTEVNVHFLQIMLSLNLNSEEVEYA